VTTTDLPRPLVSTAWLADNLGAPDLRVIDCSVVMRKTDDGGYTFVGGLDEWQEGHIPGAAFVDVLKELADPGSPLPMTLPPAGQFAAVMGKLGVGPGTRTVLYDRSNHAWAARVWWMLRAFGYETSAVLDGGYRKWTAEDRPAGTGDHEYPPASFSATARPELIASRDQVRAALDAADALIVNALSPEEHAGTTSRFPRAGRIAGSVNVYCQSLVDPETNAYLAPDEIRRRFESAGLARDSKVITYCGAGIAASSDALALAVIGHHEVAVYDGSLSEWTADDSLPMETD